MYIQQAQTTLNDWWRYAIGLVIAIVGVGIFSIPHAVGIGYKVADGTLQPEQMQDITAIMHAFSPNINLVFVILQFIGGLIFLFIAVKFLHRQSLRSLTTARPKVDWKRIFFAFFFWGILSSGLVIADYFITPNDYQLNFNLEPFLILCAITFLMLPFQTSFEEYLFRGYLMQGIGNTTPFTKFPFVVMALFVGTGILIALNLFFSIDGMLTLAIAVLMALAIFMALGSKVIKAFERTDFYKKSHRVLNRVSTPLIITSLIFGLLHIANPEVDKLGYGIMVYYIGTGLFLGIITLMDDGMELALGFHAANNMFTALLVTADWTALQTDSVFKDISEPSLGLVELIIPVFVMFPLLAFLFGKIYKWDNWSQKLFGRVALLPQPERQAISKANTATENNTI